MLQCGADSLCGDRIGLFNLSIRGHGECVKYMKSFGVPMVLIGGGGYSLRNVARCWTYETAVACAQDIPNEIPANEYSMYFYPQNKIHVRTSNQENLNTREEIEQTTKQICENLKSIKATTVNYDYYHNGQPGPKPNPFMAYDASENRQAAQDRDPEARAKPKHDEDD